jgi:NTP pyrophosphatase (non-canonical NTP hydrolase)
MAFTPLIPADYPNFVRDRFKRPDDRFGPVLHAVLGIAGEAGELVDAIKKHWAYGKPLDLANVFEELGDIEFYLMALRIELGVTREQILVENMAKLSRRYPKAYSDELAIARLDKETP